MKSARVIFAGTPDFSVASLSALVGSGVRPVVVLTQPDRPAGRGKKLTASPVKQYATEQGIPVLQPASLRDEAVANQLRELEPDIMVVAAYGLILPQNVLDIPAAGCLNVHASILPRWRGAAPIQAAILAGDEETGVCLMAMTAGLDCGPVYACSSVAIGENETAGELHDRLARLGGELLVCHFAEIVGGELKARDQDDSLATHAPKIKNKDAILDWQRTAAELARAVRAFNPVPGAWFMIDDERVKCWQATAVAGVDAPAGLVVTAGADGIVVSCAEGGLRLESLQRPGRRRVTAGEFAAQIDLVGRQL